MRIIRKIASFSILTISISAIVACGGGGGGGGGGENEPRTDSLKVNIEGRAVKGAMIDPNIEIYLIKDGVISDKNEYSASSDAMGNFSFHSPIYTPPPFSAVLKTNSSLKYHHKCDFYPSCDPGWRDFGDIDTLNGGSAFFHDQVTIELRSYVPALASEQLVNANVSVLTTFAVAMAEGMSGKLTDVNALKAKQTIEDMFGLSERNIDIQATKLIDLTDVNEWSSATEDERYHSVMNAAIIGMPKTSLVLQRESAGLPPFQSNYKVIFDNIITDLAFNGQFGSDDKYKDDVIQLSINIGNGRHNVSLNGYIGPRGEIKLSSSNEDYDEVVGRMKDGGFPDDLFYLSTYRHFHYVETGKPSTDNANLKLIVNDDGTISGTSESHSGSELAGVVSGYVSRIEDEENRFNTNSGFDIERYKSIAKEQMSLLHGHYGTAP